MMAERLGDPVTLDQIAGPAVMVDGLPRDRDELQKLLNRAYRKGNDDAHAAHAVVDSAHLEAQRGGVVVVPEWIAVSDRLPEDGATVGFITECGNDRWYHGRILGGRYRAGEFGGFSVPGLTVQASHWFQLPAIPEEFRAQQAKGE